MPNAPVKKGKFERPKVLKRPQTRKRLYYKDPKSSGPAALRLYAELNALRRAPTKKEKAAKKLQAYFRRRLTKPPEWSKGVGLKNRSFQFFGRRIPPVSTSSFYGDSPPQPYMIRNAWGELVKNPYYYK